MGRASVSHTIGVSVRRKWRAELGELYAAQADFAKRLAYLLTGDSELAEDITQDAFVKDGRSPRRSPQPGRLCRLPSPNGGESLPVSFPPQKSGTYLSGARGEHAPNGEGRGPGRPSRGCPLERT